MLPLLALQDPTVMLRIVLLDCVSFILIIRIVVLQRRKFNKTLVDIGGLPVMILLIVLKVVVEFH